MNDLHQPTGGQPGKIGYLFVNLGTPASTSVADVRRYLKEFLMDPYVLAMPWPIRKLIVSGFILPFRPKNSAEAYAKIWTDQGSPLLTISEALTEACATTINAPCTLAMRYGEPSIEAGLNKLTDEGVAHIRVVPLYPHYADSTVTTTIEKVQSHLPAGISAETLQPFYQDPGYIEALRKSITEHLTKPYDHLLLSYHSLPEFHLNKADPTDKHCLQAENCCNPEPASPAHATCYRHHVMMTSTALAAALNLSTDQYTVSFQSRLGRVPWLRPYTDETLAAMPGQGIRHLAVACPAFVVDNLETLEEIGIQGRETFLEAGGESFQLVPCLNHDSHWVTAFSHLLQQSNAYTELARA